MLNGLDRLLGPKIFASCIHERCRLLRPWNETCNQRLDCVLKYNGGHDIVKTERSVPLNL